MTDEPTDAALAFDRFTLDTSDERLSGPDGPIQIGNKAYRVLRVFAESRGNLVTKDALFESVWDGTVVSESALTSVIKELRRALGDDSKTPRIITSVYGRGYRFIPEVRTATIAPKAMSVAAPIAPAPPAQTAIADTRSTWASRRGVLVGGGLVAVSAAGAAAWTTGLLAPAAAANSVALIPFKNVGGDPEQAYFADGLSEEIRLELARNPALKVMGPASVSFAMKNGDIAKTLDVAKLLSGSVRRGGDVLRVSAELTDGKTGYTAWADTFDRPIDDVFAVQADIAKTVARVMSIEAGLPRSAAKGKDRGEGGTSSVAAYDHYLRGVAYYNDGSSETVMRAASAQLDAALAADPGYARAMSLQARLILDINAVYGTPAEFRANVSKALLLARAAVDKAPGDPIGSSILGFVLVQGLIDIRGADSFFRKAMQLAPGSAPAQSYFATYAAQMGRVAEADAPMARALALDPLNAWIQMSAVYVALLNRNWRALYASSAKALQLNPKIGIVNGLTGDALYANGEFARARAAYLAEPVELVRLTGLAIVAPKLGDQTAGEQAFAALIKKFPETSNYQQAQVLAQWGRSDDALTKLEAGHDVIDSGLASLYRDPMLDPLRKDARYFKLLKTVGFV